MEGGSGRSEARRRRPGGVQGGDRIAASRANPTGERHPSASGGSSGYVIRPLSPVLIAGLAAAVLVLATRQRVPRPDEPALLRWGRTAAAHPFRTTLALSLLVAGLRGPTRGRGSVDAAALPRAEADEELG
jgi:hypothetical protein